MTIPLYAGAVGPGRAGTSSLDGTRTIRADGEPRAGGSNDDVTVEVGRRIVLRGDPPARRIPTSGALVGRERELTTLREALRASEVDGRAIVIGGDAGSGKSALLDEFRADVRSEGIPLVEGACVEIESRRPFGAFADLLASCEKAFGSERVQRALKERGVKLREMTSPGATDAGGRGGDRYQVHGAILGLFSELTSEGALAVFIEDLHWADEASLELFGYLARRLRGRPVLLVGTYRTDELDRRHPLRPALADLRRARLIEELPLPALDIGETGRLIHARLGLREPAPLELREFRDMVHARCEGNPLHTEETLDTLRQSGHLRYADNAWTCDVRVMRDALPASVADSVVARWAALSHPTQQVLLVASVAGHRFDLELLAAVSDMSTEALAPLIHEAIDARLVLEETKDQPLTFRHALTREALQQQLLQSERVALHAKIAAFLQRRRATTPVPAAELAYHLEESGDRAAASRYHEATAGEAAAMTDYRSAARSMERAIATAATDDPSQARRQLDLVGYLRSSGDDPRASRAAIAALEIAEKSGDPRLQAQALLDLYAVGYVNSDEIPGRQPLDRALALLEPLGPTAELARTLSAIAGASARLGDANAAVASAERARRIATELRLTAELAFATLQVAISRYSEGRLAEAVATTREAIEIAKGAGLLDELYAALVTLRTHLLASGASSQEQRDVVLQMRAVAKAHGLGDQRWIVRELTFLHGEADWDGFLELLPHAPEPDRSDFDVPRLMGMFTAIARGGPGEAGELDADQMHIAYGNSTPPAAWAAQVLLLSGLPAAVVKLAASVRDEDVSARFWGLMPASIVHAIGLFAARDCDDVTARERFIESLLRDRPLPVAPTFNRRFSALADADIAERAGRIDDALAAYAVALAECERAQDNSAMYSTTLIRQRRAELYLRATPPNVTEAQAELDALLPYWQKAKATWYLGQLRTWAERHGLAFPKTDVGTSTAAPATSKQLTRRELEIARLVAQGLTNREIGAQLGLSVRTAEGHVEQIRAKLGFRTRSQIAAWVAERYGAARPN